MRFLASTAAGFGSAVGGFAASRISGADDPDRYLAISEIAVAAAVATVERGRNARHLVRLQQLLRSGQAVHDVVAFCVDVRINVVRDLAGAVAQPDAAVECGGTQPGGPAVVTRLVALPEADMVALLGTAAHQLLEGQILLAAKDVQTADRRVVVFVIQHDTLGDVDARAHRDRVGRMPMRGQQGADHFLLRSHQANVQRIARNAVVGDRDLGCVDQVWLMLVVLPQGRHDKIGNHQVQQHAP